MKKSRLILALMVVTVALSVIVVAHAQAAQTSFTLNLNYYSVQLTYPSQVNPGDLVTVNVQATPKNGISGATLTAQVFYVDGNTLRQLTSATLTNNGGSTLNKQITFTVPQDAPRTSLFASVTEKVQTAYASYYYYPTYYNSSSPYCNYYPDYYDYYGYCGYSYSYYPYSYPYSYSYYPYSYNYYAYPSYSYSTATDSGVAPLSYIKAQTPEYVALQSQYQTVNQQLNQSQAQNQQLQQQLQNDQNTIQQRNATIANLNQQLSTNQNTNTTLEAAAGGLGILAVIFGAFAVHYRGKSSKPQTPPPSTQAQQSTTK